MHAETHIKEQQEAKSPELQGFQQIRPDSGRTVSDADAFWKSKFENTAEKGKPQPKEYFDDNGVKYREGNELLPNTTFERNGYEYSTDDQGRLVSAEGQLQVKNHDEYKSISDDKEVIGRGAMRSTDHRGHLIADRFNGASDLGNLVPMDGKLNKGDYAKLETKLADAVSEGAVVYMKVECVYHSDTARPSEFRISYTIDGEKDMTVFRNGSDSK